MEAAIRAKDLQPALQWCEDNGSRLRKLESTLEFRVRMRDFLEMVRANEKEEVGCGLGLRLGLGGVGEFRMRETDYFVEFGPRRWVGIGVGVGWGWGWGWGWMGLGCGYLGPALQWCEDNISRLRNLERSLEFHVREIIFLEMVRTNTKEVELGLGLVCCDG